MISNPLPLKSRRMKKVYPPQQAFVIRMPFWNVEDKIAKEFLGDVLFSRMTESQGYIDDRLKPVVEARAMASEMGLQEGWSSEQAKSVTLEQVVSRVLQGGLRVAYQTPPRG